MRAGRGLRGGDELASDSAAITAPQLHVSGNRLLDRRGQQVVLHGVDRSGGEFACVQGWGILDGPMNQAAVSSMKTWNVTTPSGCRSTRRAGTARRYVKPAYRGARYRQAVEAYVRLLNAQRPGRHPGPALDRRRVLRVRRQLLVSEATCQKPMPDAAQAIPFWTSVARAFKGNNAVIFDLFNEPFPDRPTGGTDGGGLELLAQRRPCAGIGYRVAGMQSLVSAVRSTGARNVLMLGGLAGPTT